MSLQHEDTCTEGQRLIEAVFDSVPGLLFLYTQDGRLIRWNNRHEQLTGYTSEELMNFRSEDWFDADNRALLAKHWPKVFSEGKTQSEFKLTLKNGRKVPYFLTGVRFEMNGKPHLVGIGIDISEMKRQEEALKISEEILKKAEEIAHLGSWQIDMEHNKIFWSDALYKIFGIPAGSPLNYERFLKLVHPEDRSLVNAAWRAFLQNAPYDIEHRIIVNDKVRWVHQKASIECNDAGEPVLGTGITHDITERKKIEEEREKALNEIKQLKDLLEAENLYLKTELKSVDAPGDVIGNSDSINYVLFRARQVAQADATVLILGETGTGKGMIARLIHEESHRCEKPLVVVNCSGLPGNLIESEMFGREKGAFTGSESRQIGRFELADGGTLFLDEIAEMPIELQAKLLRVIEDGEFERLGSPHTVKVNVRIIAATSRNIEEEIANGRFRRDLFYRLNIFPITLSPLRERKDDIPLLAHFFLENYSRRTGKNIATIPEKTMRLLRTHNWPGNVRELKGIIERMVITNFDTPLELSEKAAYGIEQIKTTSADEFNLAAIEKNHISQVLKKTGWRIEGPKGAAKLLGMHPSTLRYRMKKLDIIRYDFEE
jgi:PAS domain S-box-containing protein